MDSIWDIVRPNLKLRLGTNYDAWCSRLEIIHEKETEIIFLSPNKYFSDSVKKNFFPIIKEELQKITHKDYELFFSNQQNIHSSPTQNTTQAHNFSTKITTETKAEIKNTHQQKNASKNNFSNVSIYQQKKHQISSNEQNIQQNIQQNRTSNQNELKNDANLSKFDLELLQLQQSFFTNKTQF